MTIARFQATVLKLSNQTFVRHYLWLNYPQDPQLMGIEFKAEKSLNGEEHLRLRNELNEAGFTFNNDLAVWVIERTVEEVP